MYVNDQLKSSGCNVCVCVTGGARLRPCCVEEDGPAVHVPARVCPEEAAQRPDVQAGLQPVQGGTRHPPSPGQGSQPLAQRGRPQWGPPPGKAGDTNTGHMITHAHKCLSLTCMLLRFLQILQGKHSCFSTTA